MLEPHVLIALQQHYQREFNVTETPPSPNDNAIVSVKYANHYLLFDFVPGLVLPKLNPKAIATMVNELRKEEAEGAAIDKVETKYTEIFKELTSSFGAYAPYAYAELLSGKPLLFFLDEAEIGSWRSMLIESHDRVSSEV